MSYTLSRVVQIIGPRGSGKSLLLASMGGLDMMRGRKVWSNMPIEVSKRTTKFYKGPPLKSIPLDWDAFYALSQELVEGTVLIDEAQYFSDSRSSLSLKNRLLNAIVAQVRKRSLNLYYTVKQGDWVDKRLNYETDIQIECFDLAWSKNGRKRHLVHGDRIMTVHRDLSGSSTGHAGYRVIARRVFHGRQWWNTYDTKAVIDLEEGFTPVRLDLKQRVISNKPRHDDIADAIDQVGGHLLSKGVTRLPVSAFQQLFANVSGMDIGSQHLGKFLPEWIKRKRAHDGEYFYELTPTGA